MTGAIHRGGCQCGAVRFVASGQASNVGYCHCRICQRTTGAPVTVWGDWDVQRFRFTSKQHPRVFASSTHGRRWFCEQCGASIGYMDERAPRTVEINILALDEPGLIAPAYHSWTSSRVAWFEIADSLPRHGEGRPEE